MFSFCYNIRRKRDKAFMCKAPEEGISAQNSAGAGGGRKSRGFNKKVHGA